MRNKATKESTREFLDSCVICGRKTSTKTKITDDRFSSYPNRKICKLCFNAWTSDDGDYIYKALVGKIGGKIEKGE